MKFSTESWRLILCPCTTRQKTNGSWRIWYESSKNKKKEGKIVALREFSSLPTARPLGSVRRNQLCCVFDISGSRSRFVVQDMESVKDYIQYAKTAIHPRISDDASQALIEEYVDMRKMGSGRGQVSAYPRQLESLIRLAEAHAKMRLSNTVEKNDVQEARR